MSRATKHCAHTTLQLVCTAQHTERAIRCTNSFNWSGSRSSGQQLTDLLCASHIIISSIIDTECLSLRFVSSISFRLKQLKCVLVFKIINRRMWRNCSSAQKIFRTVFSGECETTTCYDWSIEHQINFAIAKWWIQETGIISESLESAWD